MVQKFKNLKAKISSMFLLHRGVRVKELKEK